MKGSRNYLAIIICAIIFGSLMAFRETFSSIWIRALVAAVAAGGSYSLWLLLTLRKRPEMRSVPPTSGH